MDGERQVIFLVRSAAAVAAQRHRELASGEDGHPAALGAHVAGEPGVFGRDIPRLALQAVAENHAFVAGGFGAGFRRGQRVGRPRDDPIGRTGKNLVAGLRRLVFGIGQRPGHGVGQFQPVFADDGAGVVERRRVRHRRARSR